MRKALSEIKQLGKTKPKKPKELDPREFLNMVMLYCYSIIQEEKNFKQFCEEEKVSAQVAGKIKEFVETKSFLSYIFNPIFGIVTNPKYTLQIPTRENADGASQNFALVILKNLVEDLETQSVESIAAKTDEIMENFQEMTEEKMAHDLNQILGDITI